jgi:rhomboid protease GluP
LRHARPIGLTGMANDQDRPRFFAIPQAAAFLLITANIAVYAICYRQGGGATIPGELLFRYGAMYTAALDRHEYWRLLAAGFLHANPIHLLGNMLCLALWGGPLEQRVGTCYFVVIYLAALVGGSIVSNLIHHGAYLSVGASGGISGILGALFCLWILARIEVTANFFVTNIGLNVALVFTVRNVDWQAHLGGFAAGMIACALIDLLERANARLMRCKFPEFVKVNALVLAGGVLLLAWRAAPATLESVDVTTALIVVALGVVMVKTCDLLLSVKHGLAIVVILLALANAALVLAVKHVFDADIASACASGHFLFSIQIENAILDVVCADIVRTLIVATAGAFLLTLVAYGHELRRGINDVGFVAATLSGERKRQQGL